MGIENFNEYIENFNEYIENFNEYENLTKDEHIKNEHAGACGSVVFDEKNNGIWLLEGNTGVLKENLQLFLETHIPTKIVNGELYILTKIYLSKLDDDYKFTTLDDAISRAENSKEIESLINGGINKKLFYCGKMTC